MNPVFNNFIGEHGNIKIQKTTQMYYTQHMKPVLPLRHAPCFVLYTHPSHWTV